MDVFCLATLRDVLGFLGKKMNTDGCNTDIWIFRYCFQERVWKFVKLFRPADERGGMPPPAHLSRDPDAPPVQDVLLVQEEATSSSPLPQRRSRANSSPNSLRQTEGAARRFLI
jgi:hypothetical protein